MGFALGIFCFVLFFILHVAIWRLSVPRKPFKAMVIVASAVFLSVVTADLGFGGLLSLPEILYGAALHGTLLISYLLFYVGIKHDSPSLSVIQELLNRGGNGFPVSQIELFSENHPFVQSRLDQLIIDKFVTRDNNGNLHATGKVSLPIRLSVTYRNWTQRRSERG